MEHLSIFVILLFSYFGNIIFSPTFWPFNIFLQTSFLDYHILQRLIINSRANCKKFSQAYAHNVYATLSKLLNLFFYFTKKMIYYLCCKFRGWRIDLKNFTIESILLEVLNFGWYSRQKKLTSNDLIKYPILLNTALCWWSHC